MSVSNFFGAQGLDLLARMLEAGGDPNATAVAAEAASLKAALRKTMWNGTRFCDRICSEVKGKGASLMMTNMFALAFGMVVADWGIYKIGNYGAFSYQLAVGSGYYTRGPASSTRRPRTGRRC